MKSEKMNIDDHIYDEEQKQVVVVYQEYHFCNEDLLESHYEKHH